MIAALLMQQQLEELDRAINHRLVELFTFQPPVKRFQRLAESKSQVTFSIHSPLISVGESDNRLD